MPDSNKALFPIIRETRAIEIRYYTYICFLNINYLFYAYLWHSPETEPGDYLLTEEPKVIGAGMVVGLTIHKKTRQYRVMERTRPE
jgi:hypothetical protein